MNQMKFPQFPSRYENDISVMTGSPIPIPSLAGFAFACCAAVLPLTQTHDLRLMESATYLFDQAIIFLMGLYISDGGSQRGHAFERQLYINRLQHFVKRFDQVGYLKIEPNFPF
jgi:hypothetical protein